MAVSKFSVLKIPDFERISDPIGNLSERWRDFFQLIIELLGPLGVEKSSEILNNQIIPADIVGLKVSKLKTSLAIVDYLIQRVTVGTNPVQLLESGTFHLVYRPTSDDWQKVVIGTPGPNSSGVTITVNSDGQAQYVSTLVDGTASISRIFYRMRTISGKNIQYSTVG